MSRFDGIGLALFRRKRGDCPQVFVFGDVRRTKGSNHSPMARKGTSRETKLFACVVRSRAKALSALIPYVFAGGQIFIAYVPSKAVTRVLVCQRE